MDITEKQNSLIPNEEVDPETMQIYEGIRQGKITPEQLQWAFDREPLTNTLNIRGFERRLNNYLLRGVPGVLVTIDVDEFKGFNDSQGHPAGDALLRRSAKILFEQTRINNPTPYQNEKRKEKDAEKDLLGRVGGDEFLIFLVGASKKDAINTAIRIRHAIAQIARREFPTYGPDQTMSLGLTEAEPHDTGQSIRQRADRALYLAKNGRSDIPQEAIVLL